MLKTKDLKLMDKIMQIYIMASLLEDEDVRKAYFEKELVKLLGTPEGTITIG